MDEEEQKERILWKGGNYHDKTGWRWRTRENLLQKRRQHLHKSEGDFMLNTHLAFISSGQKLFTAIEDDDSYRIFLGWLYINTRRSGHIVNAAASVHFCNRNAVWWLYPFLLRLKIFISISHVERGDYRWKPTKILSILIRLERLNIHTNSWANLLIM